MRNVLLLSGAILALQLSGASATTLEWSYSGPGVSGAGTMDATYVSGVGYSLDSISGTANGQTILALDSYDAPDNFVFPPSPPNVGVDSLGFSFSVGDGSTSYNLYEDDGLYTPGPPYGCGAVYCLLGPGTVGAGDPYVALTSFSVTVVPELSTWMMMLVGFAGLSFAGYRKAKSGRTALSAA
jgi:hypothetical protein